MWKSFSLLWSLIYDDDDDDDDNDDDDDDNVSNLCVFII